MVMGLECMTVNIDGRGMIKRKKPGKAAAVIVVAVGQNGDIHGCKVNAEYGGIA